MRGWVKVLAVLVVVCLLLAAGAYVYGKWKRGSPGPAGDDGSPQVVKVNESAVSVYIGALDPEPALSSVTLRLYAPGLGHVDRPLPPPHAGVLRSYGMFPGVDLEYHDLDNDSAAGNGDFFTVLSGDGALRTGIWHAEVLYEGHRSGEVAFSFHVLPPGVDSVPEDVEVDFIDVGQGDAQLVRTSDGKRVLIDAGPPGAEDELLAYLRERSVTSLDALIISHPDADHLGGAEEVLQALEVRSVYHPGLAKNTSSFWSFVAAAGQEGCPVYTSEDVQAGDYLDISVSEDFRVLSINASDEANDASIVLRVSAPSRSFLFTGDIGFDVENALLSSYPEDLDVDVLKVAHHGSRTSSSASFLEAVSPSLAVIEVGTNTYGHPTEASLSRLAEAGATVVRTDQAGTYAVASTGGTVR